MKTSSQLLVVLVAVFLCFCQSNDENQFIYNGQVESQIIRLYAQVTGNLDSLFVEEGQAVRKDQLLAKINSDKLLVQLKQQQAQSKELDANFSSLLAQLKQVQSQLNFLTETYEKTKQMVTDGAATEQRRDELATQVDVLKAQMDGLLTNKKVIEAKREQLAAVMELIRISVKDTKILSPLDGTVLNKFIEENELITPGRVIFELADLSKMEVTIYIPLTELNRIQIGQDVGVLIDGYEGILQGRVKWVASESEFTPKTILTKETRTTLVYAVKIDVPNPEGLLKIGMPVEVSFKL